MTFSQRLVTEEKYCSEERSAKALKIFGHSFVYSPAKLPEGEYEYHETEEGLSFLGLSLPIQKLTGHYRIMESRSKVITPEEAEDIIMEKAEKYERNFLTGGKDGAGKAQILDREISKLSDENGVTITINYTLEGEIGEEKMILAKYEAPKAPEQKREDEK